MLLHEIKMETRNGDLIVEGSGNNWRDDEPRICVAALRRLFDLPPYSVMQYNKYFVTAHSTPSPKRIKLWMEDKTIYLENAGNLSGKSKMYFYYDTEILLRTLINSRRNGFIYIQVEVAG